MENYSREKAKDEQLKKLYGKHDDQATEVQHSEAHRKILVHDRVHRSKQVMEEWNDDMQTKQRKPRKHDIREDDPLEQLKKNEERKN